MSEVTNSYKLCVSSYERHIFVCVGEKCHPSDGLPLYEYLKEELRKNNADPALRKVKRSQSKCLGVCQRGPVAVVYPEGAWYGDMTQEKMTRVIREHLQKGQPITEWVSYAGSNKGEGEGA